MGAAGRVASSLSAVSSNPGELTSDATDKSLSTVSSITESDEKLGGDAVVGFASAAPNLLKSSKGQFEEARRRRRLSEGNETALQLLGSAVAARVALRAAAAAARAACRTTRAAIFYDPRALPAQEDFPLGGKSWAMR